MSVNPPVARCESCHAQVDDTEHLPTLTMRPREAKVEHVQRETWTGALRNINFDRS